MFMMLKMLIRLSTVKLSARRTPMTRTQKHEPDKIRPERIAKVIARAGICSRRDAEKLIVQGLVKVNGQKLDSPAFTVVPSDKIEVDGKPLPQVEPTQLWLYHKPRGLVTSHKDEKHRDTVFEKLPVELPRVVSVGRLDINTEGLLLLTNDGELARQLELPKTGWLRRYRVRAFGVVSQVALDRLKDGISVNGVHYGPIEAAIERQQGGNQWLTVALREGKNREIKHILEALGLKVNRLIRISFGPFQLGDLKAGDIKAVKQKVLRDQIGKKFAPTVPASDKPKREKPHANHRRRSQRV
jgi:23S rRNA pseudouridine2605 synthase